MNSRRLILAAAFFGYLILVCLPLMIAFYSGDGRSLTRRPFWDDLGSGLAMVGFAAILMEFVLLGRFRPLSTSLGSDFLMQAHQLLARTALLLLVLHPFFYSLWGDAHKASDASFAAALKIDGLSLLTGGIAWVLLLSLIFSATKRAGYDYDRWRRYHALLAVLLAGFGMHHVLAAGRYSAFTPLANYWWMLAALAALAILTVYVFRPLLQKQKAFAIASIKTIAKDIYELVIRPVSNRHVAFKSGQFAWIKIGSTSVTHDHPFSIASSPNDSGELWFVIKSVGDFTSSLAQTAIGTHVYVDGPHGHFRIPDNASAVIMIAGGIGIAPFCGLLSELADAGDRRPIRLIYGNRLATQEVDIRQLAQTKNLDDFHLISVIGEPRTGDQGIDGQPLVGQLDEQLLAQILKRPDIAPIRDQAAFMVCGPAVMIDAVEASLVALGVPLNRIISEKFQYDFDLQAPRSRRTLMVWLLASVALLAAVLTAALR